MSFVTLACEGCGARLEQPATGRRRHTCSSPCRQKAYRQRTRNRVLDLDLATPSERVNENGPPRLTAETRGLLRVAIDLRRRQLLVAGAEITEADRALFADERECA